MHQVRAVAALTLFLAVGSANAQNQKRDRSFAPASDAHGTILPRRRSKTRCSVPDGPESDTNSVVVRGGMTLVNVV